MQPVTWVTRALCVGTWHPLSDSVEKIREKNEARLVFSAGHRHSRRKCVEVFSPATHYRANTRHGGPLPGPKPPGATAASAASYLHASVSGCRVLFPKRERRHGPTARKKQIRPTRPLLTHQRPAICTPAVQLAGEPSFQKSCRSGESIQLPGFQRLSACEDSAGHCLFSA
jgi:hypothetical protein